MSWTLPMAIDLTTQYGGLKLPSPVVVGACPLTAEDQTRLAIAVAGAGAIVLPSLFQEQVLMWNENNGRSLSARDQRLPESTPRVPVDSAAYTADDYLALVNRASGQSSIPIIASLNVEIPCTCLDFAAELQAAGAAAIELNVLSPPPTEFAATIELEDALAEMVSEINNSISIPLILKIDTCFTSPSHLAQRLQSGVQGLVLFGRAPDIDICLDTFQTKVDWQLTPGGSVASALRTIMRVHSFCPTMSLAASGGIGSPPDVIKVLLAGADVAMVTSAVYREGPDVVRTFVDGLRLFMEKHHLKAIAELQMKRPIEFTSEQQRQHYIRSLSSRLQQEEICHDIHAIHGDRWGHTTVDENSKTD